MPSSPSSGGRYGEALASTFNEDALMLDVIFIAVGVAFLLGCVAYAYACERL